MGIFKKIRAKREKKRLLKAQQEAMWKNPTQSTTRPKFTMGGYYPGEGTGMGGGENTGGGGSKIVGIPLDERDYVNKDEGVKIFKDKSDPNVEPVNWDNREHNIETTGGGSEVNVDSDSPSIDVHPSWKDTYSELKEKPTKTKKQVETIKARNERTIANRQSKANAVKKGASTYKFITPEGKTVTRSLVDPKA